MHRDVFRERVPVTCTKDFGRSLPFGAGAGMHFAFSLSMHGLKPLVSSLGTVAFSLLQAPWCAFDSPLGTLRVRKYAPV